MSQPFPFPLANSFLTFPASAPISHPRDDPFVVKWFGRPKASPHNFREADFFLS